MKTKDIVEELRYEAKGLFEACKNLHFARAMTNAANRLEQLEEQLEAVKAKRDEAIKQGEWIPVETEPTEPDYFVEYEFVITSPLPDAGQEILVTNGKRVWCDIFYDDDGCYTDGGYNFGTDIIAWRPLPAPYKDGEQECEIDDEP